jgi:hypothetical protein
MIFLGKFSIIMSVVNTESEGAFWGDEGELHEEGVNAIKDIRS